MKKARSHLWVVLSLIAVLFSVFPIQTIAENLQPNEGSNVRNLQLTDSESEKLPQEIDPSSSVTARFDLIITEDEKQLFALPSEITATDQEIYHDGEVAVSIEENQLKVVNGSGEQTSAENLSFDFKLADTVRSLSKITMNFFNEYEFQLGLKQEQSTKDSTEKKRKKEKTTESAQQINPLGGGITPFAGADKTSQIPDMKLNNIYIKNSSNTPVYIVKDGVPQVPQPTVKVGDGVYFDYTFTVPSAVGLQNGDYIYIALPEEYFTFSTVSNSVPFYVDGSSEKIGDMTVETISGKKYLKITFNEAVEKGWNGLDDCYATAYGTANKESSGGSTGNTETGSYPIEIDPKPNESFPGKPIGDQNQSRKMVERHRIVIACIGISRS